MGTSNSQNQQREMNDPYLNNPVHQNLLHSIYQNNSSIVPSYNAEDPNSEVSVSQPTVKKTKAYKNPTIIRKESIKLERDAYNQNLFYIQFFYDSSVDFELNIYFDAGKDDNTTFSSSPPFKSSVIKLLLPKGDRAQFNNPSAAIDANYFFKNKQNLESHFDMIIEVRPKSYENIHSILAIYCTFIEEKASNNKSNLKIKPVLQEFWVQGNWYRMNDVFGLAGDSNSQDCEICCAVRKNSVFEPCKHSYACYDCAQNLRKRGIPCPICRTALTGLLIIENQESSNTTKDTERNKILK